MSSATQSNKAYWFLILVFFLFSFAIGTAGYFFYENQKAGLKQERWDQLNAVANLKLNQIVSWRKERIADAKVIFENPFISDHVQTLIQNPNRLDLKKKVSTWMASLKKYFDYNSVILLDAKGIVRLSVPETKGPLCSYTQQMVAEAVRTPQIILSDLHKGPDEDIHIGLIVPILNQKGHDVSVIALLLLQVDPHHFLYPLIQEWPTPSRSGETLLIRQEGQEIVFLSELRHQKGTALTLRFPLSQKHLPAAMVARGKEGVVEGVDYRGVQVLAATRHIPDSPWFIVAKVDLEEIYAPIYVRMRFIAVLVGLLIIGAALSVALLWRGQRAEFKKRQYQAELERMMLAQHLDYLTKYANDILLLTDENGRIIEANDRALQSYGYTREELLQLTLRDLRTPETRSDLDIQIKEVKEHNGMVFETIHQRKNGTRFPVENSARMIEADGKTFYQSIIRDTSERKLADENLKEAYAELSAIYANVPIAMVVVDRERRVREVNGAAAQFVGRPAEEMIGLRSGEALRCLHSLADPKGCGFGPFCETCLVRHTVLDTFETGTSYHGVETKLPFARGENVEERWLLIYTSLIKIAAKEMVLVCLEDITDRKRAEEVLRQERNRANNYLDIAGVIILALDSRGDVILINRKGCEILRCHEEDMIGMNWFDHVIPERERDEVKNTFSELMKGDIEPVEYFENPVLTRSGEERVIAWHNTFITNEYGDIVGTLSSGEDITDRKKAEEATRKSERRLQELFDSAPVGYFEYDTEGRITNVNRTELEMLGYTSEEMIGQPVWKFIVEEEVARQQIIAKLAGTSPPSRGLERRYRQKDGTILPVLIEDRLLKDLDGRIIGIRSTIQDITQRKRAEEALQESEKRFRQLFDEAPVGYHEYNVEGRITSVNQTELEMLGYRLEEVIGQSVWNFIVEGEGSRQAVLEKLSGELPPGRQFERTYRRKDGTTFPALIEDRLLRDTAGKVIGVRSTLQDIAEREKAEQEMVVLQEQLRQSQKMEAIGRLAGGIAHDFNNLLTVIRGYSQLASMELKESDPLKENIEEIQKATERASALVHHLLAFSRRQLMEMKVIDLNSLLTDLDKMLRRIIGEDIELVTYLAEDLGRVKVDPGQMEQVIMNLAVNARDAMPSGGKLTLETANVGLDEAYARNHIAVKTGRYVMLSISDAGVGMTPEVKERVFEPFFTTKEKGKGTGLGLSVVYGIVKQSGGNIWVYSEAGKGTAFKIYLPRVDEPLEEVRRRVEIQEIPRGSEIVLVVEDEEEVRKLAVRVLQRQGYKTLEASAGGEALLICEEQKGTIHLMLTDVVMPKMSGRELADRLLTLHPEMKVLYMSGYTDNAIFHHGVLEKGLHFIQKPFTPAALARKIREVLDK